MTTLVVETTEGVQIRLDLAGAGSRFAAGLLDLILLGIALTLLLLLIVMVAAVDPSGMGGFLLGLYIAGSLFLVMGYHMLFHWLWSGATPGKRALGIRVVSTDGQPATPFQLFVRALIQPIDVILMLPISIGLIVIAATPRSQRLGDLAAGTMVIRPVETPWVEEPFAGETWSGLPVKVLPLTTGLVAKLSPDDRALLRELVVARGLIQSRRRELFVSGAQHFADKLGLGGFTDARDVLKELYLFLREFPPQATT